MDILHEINHFFKQHKEYKIVHSHLDAMSTYPLKYAKKHGVPYRIAHSHNYEPREKLEVFNKNAFTITNKELYYTSIYMR